MSTLQESLTTEIKDFASELRRLEQRLKSEPAPDMAALNDFRVVVDTIRLTAWSISELANAEQIKMNPDAVLTFLSGERLRRFEQLVKNLCSDVERGLITGQTAGMQTLCDSVTNLQVRLMHAMKQRPQGLRVGGEK